MNTIMATSNVPVVFSGVDFGVNAVHPYMSLYFPVISPVMSETEEDPNHFVEADDDFKSKSIRTSNLQKRPVVYATRIYDAISAEQQRKKNLKPKANKIDNAISVESQEQHQKQRKKQLDPKANQIDHDIIAELQQQRKRKQRKKDADPKAKQIDSDIFTKREQQQQRKKDADPKENQIDDVISAERQEQQQRRRRKQRKKDLEPTENQFYDHFYAQRQQQRKQRKKDLDSRANLDERSRAGAENSTKSIDKSSAMTLTDPGRKKTIDNERCKMKNEKKKEGLKTDRPSLRRTSSLSETDAQLKEILGDAPDCADYFSGGRALRLTPTWVTQNLKKVKTRLAEKLEIDKEINESKAMRRSSESVEKKFRLSTISPSSSPEKFSENTHSSSSPTPKKPIRNKARSSNVVICKSDTKDGEQSRSSAYSDIDQPGFIIPTKKRRKTSDKCERNNSSLLMVEDTNDDDIGDCKERPKKRLRNSASSRAISALDTRKKNGKKSIVDGESGSTKLAGELGQRYSKRKGTPANISSDDCDRTTDEEHDVKSECSKSRQFLPHQIGLLPHQVGTWVDPNGKYPSADYEAIIKQREFNENYDEDIKTDNGNYSDRKWNAKFREVWAYYKKRKTFTISKKYTVLASWVHAQRRYLRMKHLHPDRVRRLSSIGFTWAGFPTWMDNFMRLKDFKEVRGHANVPKRYKDEHNLGLWARHQRALYNHERYQLRREQIDLLESIGFKWIIRDTNWRQRLKELAAFKKEHDHFRVPPEYPNKLARWFQLRREEFARNKLPKDHLKRLNVLGHDWMIDTSKK